MPLRADALNVPNLNDEYCVMVYHFKSKNLKILLFCYCVPKFGCLLFRSGPENQMRERNAAVHVSEQAKAFD